MFITLEYFWIKFIETTMRGKPNLRLFILFLRMLGLEIKSLLSTGFSIYELNNKY